MKKLFIIVLAIFSTTVWPHQAKAQTDEAAQLLLNVEKLAQFKQILADLKKGYEVVSKGYSSIKDLSQGNFNLHKTFLDALMEVSPTVRKYKKVSDIIEAQITLVKEYKSAMNRSRAAGKFSAQELDYMGGVYNKLFNESTRNLEDLTTVVTAGKLRMTDDERLKEIDRIDAEMQDKLTFLRVFNGNNSVLAAQREKEQNNASAMKRTYGIK